MSHDIVKLLRDVPRGIGGHYHHLMQNAADEIERLRAGGCARDQKITQYCAEAVALQSEVNRLRELSGDAGQLREERDEARREVCLLRASSTNATQTISSEMEEYARSRTWECFKETSRGDD